MEGKIMGRSVSYLNNAEVVLYFPFECEDDFSWQGIVENLQYEINKKLPSYYEANDWDNRETKIILKNHLCNIGISEYCGLVSLSVAPKNNQYDAWHESFALWHANQIKRTLEKVLNNLGLKNLHKVGTSSNGEAFFELAK
jgi:hypothetical protein